MEGATEQRRKVVELLEAEQRPGLPGLDRTAFRALVQRFCDLAGLPVLDVSRLAIRSALVFLTRASIRSSSLVSVPPSRWGP